jgi:hypothetical protein
VKKLAVAVLSMILVVGLVKVFSEGPPKEDPPSADVPESESPKPVAVRQTSEPSRALVPKNREDGPPKPPRGAVEPTEAQLAGAPFVRFSSRAAPRWQGVSLELKRLGHTDLAEETWSMAGWIRDQRSDAGRDDEAILEAQRDLLGRVEELVGLDALALEQIHNVRSSITGYSDAWEALD